MSYLAGPGRLAAVFECACLVRCGAGQPGQPRRPAGRLRPTDRWRVALAEFGREQPADRLVQLVQELGYTASRELASAAYGSSARHRVVVSEPAAAGDVGALLAAAWRDGRQVMLGGRPSALAGFQHGSPSSLARRAWRAALLTNGCRVDDVLTVRLTDREMAAVLVRGARLLDVDPAVHPRQDCLLVMVPDPDQRTALLKTVNLVRVGRTVPGPAMAVVGGTP